jgi:hypothetical protein
MKKVILAFICAIILFAQNEEVYVFDDNFATQTNNVKIAVVIDKKKFFKFLSPLMNSLNSYLIYKNTNYDLKLFDINDDLNEITQKYPDIIYFTTEKEKIYSLKDYNASFYVPTFNSYDFNQTFENVYFGLIDFKAQIFKLAEYIDDNKAVVIHYKGTIPQKLLTYENELNLSLDIMDFPKIKYYKLRNRYIFFNTSTSKTAQILAQITYKNLKTKLQLATQINYDPLLIAITQPHDTKKLIIANSILNLPTDLEDTNLNLKTDIKFNWLNYSTSALANKIYNKQTNDDEFYLNDFKIYMFNHQINYSTKIYRILNNGFKTIE